MNLVTALIGLLLVALFALPFILSGSSRKKTEKRLLALLQTQAQEQNSTLNEYDFGAHIAIGLSHDSGYVYCAKESQAGTQKLAIPLQKMKLCRANTITQKVASGKQSESVIVRLELVLFPKDAKAPEQRVVLFDVADLMQLSNELELMKKWEARINSSIIGQTQAKVA